MGAEGLKTEHNLHSEVPTTQRKAVTREVPTEWIDALLAAASSIPPSASVEEAANTMIAAVSDAIPDVAIGACIPTDQGQIVVRRSPRTSFTGASSPAHLFPEFTFERVLPVQFVEGATLHLASDEEERVAETGPWDLLLDRLSLALGAALRHARAYDRSRKRSAQVGVLQAQVIQSEKLASLGQIAAGIVHELNNPLTSIVAYSDYLRKKGEKTGVDPADLERLARINEAADRILRFSRDLIAYSRPSNEVPAPVAIHDIIERALVFCEHVIEKSNVVVERTFGEVKLVRGVGGQLTQVFVNLFTNACQAMGRQGGCLSITTAMSACGSVSISISDEGSGIDAEHLPRIFEPFFTTKTDGTGTGLGLSIVRNIISTHGGTIRADDHPPRGTIFTLELPAAATGSDH